MIEFNIFLDQKLIHKKALVKDRVTVGRASDNDLILNNPHVSRLHVVIRRDENHYVVENKSSNGIVIEGEKITDPFVLPPKCRLQVFPFEIECVIIQEPEGDGTLPLSRSEIPLQRDACPTARGQECAFSGGLPDYHFGTIVGESPLMQKVYRLIEDVADSNATVLIRGEHGTGKELVASAIHELSRRKEKPFIAVNCAAIPFDLIESELFGHEKGAFTGASAARKGKIEEANGGTLFLDEIGELSLSAQSKLLRFLQGKVIMPLGGAREIGVDVRVVTATNKDLEKAVKEENFRADLYYRIKVVQIRLPSLKEHAEDIPLLANHFLKKLGQDMELPSTPILTDDAAKRLISYRWPGNIRQLENILYSAVIRSKPPYILDAETIVGDSQTWDSNSDGQDEDPIDEINKQHLLKVLTENQWDTVKTAKKLKVSRGTIYYKMKKYGIVTPEMKSHPSG